MSSVITINHCPLWKVLSGRKFCSWSFVQCLGAPLSGAAPQLVAGQGSFSGLAFAQEPQPRPPGACPYRAPGVLAHFPSAAFSPPGRDQAGKTGARRLGTQTAPGRHDLCPCRPLSLQEHPRHVAAHAAHCDPSLWPCLLLTQRFPIFWG